MGRLSALAPIFAVLLATTMALSACGDSGSDELLPGATASQINDNLSQVERLVAEGECIGAENSAAEIDSQVQELTGVDKELKQALAEGASRLTDVVAECEESETEETVPPVEETEEAEPEEKPKDEKEQEKAEKEAEKEAKEAEKEAEKEEEGPTLPPQSNGKGEEKGEGNGPPVEPPAEESPSGGVGPGTAVEGE